MYAWLLEKLTSKLAVPLLGALLLTNIVSGVGLAITRHTLESRTKDLALERMIHAQDLAMVAATTAKAEADDALHKIRIEAHGAKISQESQNEIQSDLAAAHAAAARIVRPRTGQAADGRVEIPYLPGSTDAPGGADGSAAGAWFSAADVDACAVSYTVAKGWQSWWAREYPVMLEGSRDPSQAPALGAVIIDRDSVNATREDGPAAQGAGLPTNLLVAVPGSVAPRVAENDQAPSGDAEGDEHNDRGPDHKNFLP